jgi:hypothetical protein
MAKSGSVNVAVTSWNSLRFTWALDSQSVANNSSVVSWKLLHIAGSDGYINSSATKAWSVTVNGTTVTGTNSVGIANNSTATLASGKTTIVHNADGSKTFSFSFSQEFGITFQGANIGTKSGSGSGTLDVIPRASQPSLITWPETTNDVGNFGDEIAIHMNRKSDVFTHTVRYAFGSQTGTIATGVTTGTTWTIPLDFMNLLPAATKGSGLIYVDTYNGSTLVGTKYTGFTASMPSSVKPTCSLQVLDATTTKDTYGSLVRGKSKLSVKVTGTPAYSSPIATYKATANGARHTEASFVTDVLTAAGTTTVTATVTDKRGRISATASASFSVLDYIAPAITALSVRRCDEDGTENDQGEYVRVQFSARITALNNKNSAAYKVRYKKSTATSYTEAAITAQAGKYTVTDAVYIFAADSSSSFDVEVTATDDFGTATRSTTASTAFTLMNWGQDGTSMGIGKVAEKANTLQIGLNVEFLGKVSGAIFDAIYPVGSIYLAYNHTNPATLFGGTWTRITNAFLWATTATGTIGQTGGEQTVKLTEAQLPAHSHGSVYSQHAEGTKNRAWYSTTGTSMAYGPVSAGSGEAHNNMPPYIQVSVWRRTA